jgi:chromosome partitioning protein
VASDHFLVPASPDYLSTLGTGRLLASVNRFVHKFNLQAREYSNGSGTIAPTPLGVVFTMVKYGTTGPNSGHSFYMEQVRRSVGDIPVFGATLRENVAFGKENPRGVPVILKLPATNKVYIELMELANEFLRAFEGGGARKAVA